MSSECETYSVTFPSGRVGIYRIVQSEWKHPDEVQKAEKIRQDDFMRRHTENNPYSRRKTSEFIQTRFWIKDEVLLIKTLSRHLDTDSLIEWIKPLYPCINEKDLIDHDTQYGYRDVYIHNKTLLTLFGK